MLRVLSMDFGLGFKRISITPTTTEVQATSCRTPSLEPLGISSLLHEEMRLEMCTMMLSERLHFYVVRPNDDEGSRWAVNSCFKCLEFPITQRDYVFVEKQEKINVGFSPNRRLWEESGSDL
jgi:hypothetical protein